MKRTLLYTTMTALLISGTTSAIAGNRDKEDRHDRAQKMFERVDSNNDGIISKSEHLSNAEQRFTEMDANGDGKVTQEEAKAHHKERREKHKQHKR